MFLDTPRTCVLSGGGVFDVNSSNVGKTASLILLLPHKKTCHCHSERSGVMIMGARNELESMGRKQRSISQPQLESRVKESPLN